MTRYEPCTEENKNAEQVDLSLGDLVSGIDHGMYRKVMQHFVYSQVQSISRLDLNSYATRKSFAQGMLDLALLTANASQLKFLLTVGVAHEFYHLLLTLVILSISLQVLFEQMNTINNSNDVWLLCRFSKQL